MNIIIARKPLEGNCISNVLKHSTGGICIDKCRVGTVTMIESRMTQTKGGILNANGRDVENGNWQQKPNENPEQHQGRFPANVIHDGSLDELFPDSKSTGGKPETMGAFGKNGVYGKADGKITANAGGLGDSGSNARFFYNIGEYK
jgi:hypothetical protein